MFERFTERARQVIVMAQESAREWDHTEIESLHLLMGLVMEEEGLAARVLDSFYIDEDFVNEMLDAYIGPGIPSRTRQPSIPFTPEAKQALEYTLREALSLGHNYIGTEHILLGLVRDHNSIHPQVAEALIDCEIYPDDIRGEVIRMLNGPGRRSSKGERLDSTTKVDKRDDIIKELTEQNRELKQFIRELAEAEITRGRKVTGLINLANALDDDDTELNLDLRRYLGD